MLDVQAFATLIRKRRGEKGWSQQVLAEKIYNDPSRKADISRLENGKIERPQEKTIKLLCEALDISAVEMVSIRQSQPDAEQLDNIPTLSREQLQNLSARFGIDNAFDLPDGDLRRFLTLKGDEYRALKSEVDGIDDGLKRLSNLKAAAQEAIARVNLEEVEDLLSRVQEVELEEAAKTAELRANNALLRGNAEQAFRLLSAAADSFSAVDPLEPAKRRIRYDNVLFGHGLRHGGPGMALSEQMIREALDALPIKEQPTLWGWAQTSLALSLQIQGSRTGGADGTRLLAEAIAAFRTALEVRTRAEHPDEWAEIQTKLATALTDLSHRTVGADGSRLLTEAVASHRAALEVYTRTGHPENWAMIQNNLGHALQKQSERTEGSDGARLLAQAVTAYRATLEVHTRAKHPVEWAMTQNNLAIALKDQGTRTEGTDGARLLAEALTTYLAALEVRTRAEHPVQWAMTQENIAIAEVARAEHGSAKEARPHLHAALDAVNSALEVYDPEHMSYDHTKATQLRNDILQAIKNLDT